MASDLTVNSGNPHGTRVAIYTNQQLEQEVTNVCADPSRGAAILEVNVVFIWGLPLLTLQRFLTLVPNIVNLELNAWPSRQPMETTFVGVHLPRLRTLHTNYDHSYLVTFLANHPTLEEVHLFTCAAPDACPLRNLDLSHVTTLAGPTDCIAPHLYGGCSRVELVLTSDRCMRPSVLFSTIRSPLRNLQELTLDFNIEEYDLLERIIAVAPLVRSLTLHERLDFNNRVSPRRPWTNPVIWARGLRRLRLLEKLGIRTASTFALPIGDVDNERTTIMRWASSYRLDAEGSSLAHPSLQQIAVWYGAIECGAVVSHGVISHWSNFTGEWGRTRFVGNPDPAVVNISAYGPLGFSF